MKFTRDESITTMVAQKLENQILSGQYPPGSKMQSSRVLCKSMDIDRNIVRRVIDILEAKKLVTKKARQGVYINNNILSQGRHEVYIYDYSSDRRQGSFLSKTLKLTDNEFLRASFNLTIRNADWKDLTTEVFRHEMAQAKTLNVQIILLSSSYIDREKLEILKNNEIPFLIVGEMEHKYPDIEFNQIHDDFAKKAEVISRFVVENKFRDLAYFAFPKSMMEYEIRYKNVLKKNLTEAGLNFYEAPLRFDPQQGPNSWEIQAMALIKLLDSGIRPDVLNHLDYVDLEDMSRILKYYGLTLGKDITVIKYHSVEKDYNMPGVYNVQTDYSKFTEAIIERMKEIIANPGNYQKLDKTSLIKTTIK